MNNSKNGGFYEIENKTKHAVKAKVIIVTA